MSKPGKIILYTTSITAIPKVKADHDRIKRVLDGKRVDYEEIDLSMNPERRLEMLRNSNNNKTLPQLHVNYHVGCRAVSRALRRCGAREFGILEPSSSPRARTHVLRFPGLRTTHWTPCTPALAAGTPLGVHIGTWAGHHLACKPAATHARAVHRRRRRHPGV
jgi:glutaredoxin